MVTQYRGRKVGALTWFLNVRAELDDCGVSIEPNTIKLVSYGRN
jgi:hypothetical protein